MSINTYLFDKSQCLDNLKEIIKSEYNLDDKIVNANFRINSDFEQLKDECWFFIETNYVDKVYRNSYYSYYSSKNSEYFRNCIRISIFNGKIDENDFYDKDKYEFLRAKYCGFIVVRPTPPSIVGRSIISPRALKDNSFSISSVKIPSTCNGVKFEIEGFPYSSQDGETITCAETTIWELMEYFSHKYSEYKSVLPSDIIKVLHSISMERQLPSIGLDISQISFALREFGFGTRIYSREAYGDTVFFNLLSCYIESGIPVVVSVESLPGFEEIGHAMVCIGHVEIQPDIIDSIQETKIISEKLKKIAQKKNNHIFDLDDLHKKFVFVDDNHPIYQKNFLIKPCENYKSPKWGNCILTHFLVPLYPKIYLEALRAKSFTLSFLLNSLAKIKDNDEIFFRTYLASSRSYKDWLITSDFNPIENKKFLLAQQMPKFIWVTEISSRELIKKKKCNGLIILDATEPTVINNKALIFASYENKLVVFDKSKEDFHTVNTPINPFSMFQNLKNY